MAEQTVSNTPFNWLSDIRPALAAQELWMNGNYQEQHVYHYGFHTEAPFYMACGAGLLAEHVRQFSFSPDIIQRMGQCTDEKGRCIFHESFLNHLQRLRLRVQLNAAPEGTVLLPGEPLLVIQGPLLQIRLLETAMKILIRDSSYWASKIALERWNANELAEEDTPGAPSFPENPTGWKMRAAYIGGASIDDILSIVNQETPALQPGEGLVQIDHAPSEPLLQIRRLFKSNKPLGDQWLTASQEESASVSKTSARFSDIRSQETVQLQITRFLNIYQPLLVKGHPVVASTRLPYLRQRTLKHLEQFQENGFVGHPRGWKN